jgi:hypothetical protein
MSDYETDFYAWLQGQAAILREWRPPQLDWENLAEEIESMGRRERNQLVNRLRVLLAHLLKWHYQPERRGPSWESTIAEQRVRVRRLLAQNPSLKPFLPEGFTEAYELGRLLASAETNLPASVFPTEPPFDLDYALMGDLEGL